MTGERVVFTTEYDPMRLVMHVEDAFQDGRMVLSAGNWEFAGHNERSDHAPALWLPPQFAAALREGMIDYLGRTVGVPGQDVKVLREALDVERERVNRVLNRLLSKEHA